MHVLSYPSRISYPNNLMLLYGALPELLLLISTASISARGAVTGVIFSFLIARFMPSSVVRSLISMAFAKSLIAFRPIFSWRSCHPANSAATTCCVYRNSLPSSSISSLIRRTLSSFSSFKRWRVSSRRPSGQRVEREREL